VENMAEFICPHCRKGSRVFSSGGAEALSKKHLIPFLGSIPMDPLVCESGESGKPVVLAYPDSPAAAAFRLIARQVAAQVSLQNFNRKTLSVELVTKK
jgi:ATP-binding protein involved in chromosome partitioning